jgi:hypothetical protein
VSGDSELLTDDLLREIESSCFASETQICDLAWPINYGFGSGKRVLRAGVSWAVGPNHPQGQPMWRPTARRPHLSPARSRNRRELNRFQFIITDASLCRLGGVLDQMCACLRHYIKLHDNVDSAFYKRQIVS